MTVIAGTTLRPQDTSVMEVAALLARRLESLRFERPTPVWVSPYRMEDWLQRPSLRC